MSSFNWAKTCGKPASIDAGFSMAEAVLPQTKPSNIDALSNLKFDF